MRELFPRVHLDVGIGLVVFEENVVLRLVLLDEIVLEGERVHFRRRDEIGKIGDVVDHRLHLRRLRGGVEILPHAVLEYARLSHIDHRAFRVEHEVDARRIGQQFQFFPYNAVHTRIIHQSRWFFKGKRKKIRARTSLPSKPAAPRGQIARAAQLEKIFSRNACKNKEFSFFVSKFIFQGYWLGLFADINLHFHLVNLLL